MFKFFLSVFFIHIFLVFGSEKIETRKINPPKLSQSNLGQRILCYRPMRRGSPNISIEQKYGKVIANNYGHGDSCWTLAPGSAEYIVNLIVTSQYGKDFNKETSITIIGAGAIGLLVAYELHSKGYQNITMVSDNFDAVTSHISGGLVAPSSLDSDSQTQKDIYKMGFKAYIFYKSIAEKKHPFFTEGAIILSAYFESRNDSGLEPYVGIVMTPAKDVVLDFGNGTTRKMVAYDDAVYIDTEKLMRLIKSYLKKNNIKFIKKKIKMFSEIGDKFIINCAGFGSKELGIDEKLIPVQGHFIMLKNQIQNNLNYIITACISEGVTRCGQKVKRMVTFGPKHLPNYGLYDVGMMGSTFVEGATDLTPNHEEFDIMHKNMKSFFGVQ